MSGRFGRRRFNRRGYSAYRRYGGANRYRSSMARRARGNARAANNQNDTSDVVINLIKPVCVGVSKVKANDNTLFSEGVCALNIFDILRKSEFYKSYANMYDQFRITSIKVKINPVQWETFDQADSIVNGNSLNGQKTIASRYHEYQLNALFNVGDDGVDPNDIEDNMFLVMNGVTGVENYVLNSMYYIDPFLTRLRIAFPDVVSNNDHPYANYTRAQKELLLGQLDNADFTLDSDVPNELAAIKWLMADIKLKPVVEGNNLNNNRAVYRYPQALTVVTAWDRTGLDPVQFKNVTGGRCINIDDKTFYQIPNNVAGKYFTVNIGDEITSYSSAQTKQLVGGATFNCVRYLYPSNQQEKSIYYSTSDLIDTYEIGYDGVDGAGNRIDLLHDPYLFIAKNNVNLGESSNQLTNILASPNIPFKPTLLIGVLGSNEIRVELNEGDNTALSGLIRPIKFNLEFDIGVTFRGLRNAQVV